MLMHGYCDGEEEGVASLNLTPEDLAQFPELEGFKIITYQEDRLDARPFAF